MTQTPPKYNDETLIQALKPVIPPEMDNEAVKHRIHEALPQARCYGFYERQEDLVKFLEIALLPQEILTDPWFAAIFSACFQGEEATPEEVLGFLHAHVLPKAKRKLNGQSIEPT